MDFISFHLLKSENNTWIFFSFHLLKSEDYFDKKGVLWNLSDTPRDQVNVFRLYRMSEYSGFNLVNRNILDHYFLSDVKGCRKTYVSDCTSSNVL